MIQQFLLQGLGCWARAKGTELVLPVNLDVSISSVETIENLFLLLYKSINNCMKADGKGGVCLRLKRRTNTAYFLPK